MTAQRSISFDRAASYYDATRGLTPEAMEKVVGMLTAEIAGRGPCLEVGIGTGRIGLTLWEAGVDIAGVDLAAAMLGTLVTKAGGSLPFPLAVADAIRLPFPDHLRGLSRVPRSAPRPRMEEGTGGDGPGSPPSRDDPGRCRIGIPARERARPGHGRVRAARGLLEPARRCRGRGGDRCSHEVAGRGRETAARGLRWKEGQPRGADSTTSRKASTRSLGRRTTAPSELPARP
jgi:hypothetical protein